MSQQSPESPESVTAVDLTQFQLEILFSIVHLEEAEEKCYGLAVKRELEDRYGEPVNHGRLYPNLDGLVEYGLLTKSALDRRTNEYLLTENSKKLLREYHEYVGGRVGSL